MAGRNVTAAFKTAIQGDVVIPVFMVQAEFNQGTVYLWTGRGDITWNSQTWTGSGTLLTCAGIKESSDLKVSEVELQFSALPAAYKALALSGVDAKNAVTVYLGQLDSSLSLIVDPEQIFKGYMDEMGLPEGGKVFRLTAVNRLAKLQEPKLRRHTHRDQVQRYPNDTSGRHITNTTKESKWGSG
jgi:hypothetical protein